MSNILKSAHVNLIDETIQIKDASLRRPRPRPKPGSEGEGADFTAVDPQEISGEGESDSPESESFDEADGYDDSYEEEYAVKTDMAPAIREEIIQSAIGEAAKIVEGAVREAEQAKADILGQVQQEADQLRQQAMNEGRQQGIASVSDEISQIARQVEQAVAAFEGERAGFESEYESNMKWMALEIASKVLFKKVDQDDSEITEMVANAVAGVRNEAWVRIDVAQEMTRLIDRLLDLYSSDEHISVNAVAAEPGSVMVESPTGLIDASLVTQLRNLKEYFEKAQV